jgi:hypothetical protein
MIMLMTMIEVGVYMIVMVVYDPPILCVYQVFVLVVYISV